MFLSTRQMRRFAELVSDVIDDMLAADFEDGFAAGELPQEIPGADIAFRELIRTNSPVPYDWHVHDSEMFGAGARDPMPITGWTRRHARPAAGGAARTRRSRAGQVDPVAEVCATPVRTLGADAPPCS